MRSWQVAWVLPVVVMGGCARGGTDAGLMGSGARSWHRMGR